ncbi:MAG: hypothetical protein ACFFDN_52550 [Candidatus Hodarchaeota archaeon]
MRGLRMDVTLKVKKIFIILAIVILVLLTLSVVGHLYKFTIGYERYLVNLFDLDREWNVPTLFAAMNLFFCSVLLYIIALSKKKKRNQFYHYWITLSIIFFYLFMDEVIQFHEQSIGPLRNMLHTSGIFFFAWIIPAALFLLMFCVIYLKFLISLPSKIRLLFVISGSLYLSGAIGGEIIGGLYQTNHGLTNLTYALITDVEEFLEMVGILVFIYALLSYISLDFNYLKIQVLNNNHR